jgi:nucleoside-diphosphate-sugar epimerase
MSSEMVREGRHVVVGGLGNLGQAMQRRLLQESLLVEVLDWPRPNPQAFLVDPAVHFTPFRLGYDDPDHLVNVLKGAICVYSMVTPDVEKGSRRDFVRTNQEGIQQLVTAAQKAGVPKFVYVSSIAVTNHMMKSVNQSEKDPLPPWNSYGSFYDRTKRLGEELVLAANNKNFKTCAIRLGGVIASRRDFLCRRLFDGGEVAGTVLMVYHSKPIDLIAAVDAATALFKAQQKLDVSEELPGKALFVTKSRNTEYPVSPLFFGETLAQMMGWKCRGVPFPLWYLARLFMWLFYTISSLVFKEDNLPGLPGHKYLDIPLFEQTFDNSLAHRLLDFQPTLSWQEALESVVEEYKCERKVERSSSSLEFIPYLLKQFSLVLVVLDSIWSPSTLLFVFILCIFVGL